MAKTEAKAKHTAGSAKTIGANKSLSKLARQASKPAGGGKTGRIVSGQTAKAIRPAAKLASENKNSVSRDSPRGGPSKTKAAEKMTTRTTLKASHTAKATARSKAAPGNAASNTNKATVSKAPAKVAVKAAIAAIKPAAKPVAKLAGKQPAAKQPAAKPAVKPAARQPATTPAAKSQAKGGAGKAATITASPAKTGAKTVPDVAQAAPVAAPRSPGGTHVSAKSAVERLVAVRAAVAAKAQGAKAPFAPATPGIVPPSAAKPYIPGASRPGSSFSSGRPGFPPGGGPNVKPMPKPSGGKHFGFKALEYIVYPAHGVGQIVAIEEQQVAGYTLELFVVNFAKDKLTLKVPAPKVAHGAIRKLADAALVQRALDCLTGRARIKRTMWSRRAQEYEAKINSGDLIAIAEVVRDLYRSDAQPEQSYSERQLFEAALDRMAREIAAVQKLTDTEALKVLDGQLQKGPRRGVKTDAAEADVESDVGQAPGEVEQAA